MVEGWDSDGWRLERKHAGLRDMRDVFREVNERLKRHSKIELLAETNNAFVSARRHTSTGSRGRLTRDRDTGKIVTR